jgi:tetratricopeptide (TPR) repeat protein
VLLTVQKQFLWYQCHRSIYILCVVFYFIPLTLYFFIMRKKIPSLLFVSLFATPFFAQSETAATVYNAALAKYKSQDFSAALLEAQRAANMKASPEAYYLAALCHKKLKSDAVTLRQAYQNVLNVNPNHADALAQIGIMSFNAKDFKAAEGYFQRAVTAAPTDADNQKLLAQAQAALEKEKNGSKIAFAGEKETPTAYAQTTKTAKTEGAQKESKNYITAYNNGVKYSNNEDFEQAVAAFKEAAELSPNNAMAQCQIGKAYANIQGEEKNARKYLAKAAELDEENPEIWYKIGDAYFVMIDKENALKAYKKANKFGMQTSELYQQIALMCYYNKKEEEATEWFEKAIVLTPNDPQLYYNMGTACLVAQKWNKGIAAFQKSINLNPKALDARFNMARAYFQLQEYDKALTTGMECVVLDPDYAKGYFACAKAYSGLKEPEKAQKYLDKAYQIDPKLKKSGF